MADHAKREHKPRGPPRSVRPGLPAASTLAAGEQTAFGALTASVDGGFTSSGINFEWNGADEGDQVTGTGGADLRDDGRLEGEIAYDNGDDTTFIADPWGSSAAR